MTVLCACGPGVNTAPISRTLMSEKIQEIYPYLKTCIVMLLFFLLQNHVRLPYDLMLAGSRNHEYPTYMTMSAGGPYPEIFFCERCYTVVQPGCLGDGNAPYNYTRVNRDTKKQLLKLCLNDEGSNPFCQFVKLHMRGEITICPFGVKRQRPSCAYYNLHSSWCELKLRLTDTRDKWSYVYVQAVDSLGSFIVNPEIQYSLCIYDECPFEVMYTYLCVFVIPLFQIGSVGGGGCVARFGDPVGRTTPYEIPHEEGLPIPWKLSRRYAQVMSEVGDVWCGERQGSLVNQRTWSPTVLMLQDPMWIWWWIKGSVTQNFITCTATLHYGDNPDDYRCYSFMPWLSTAVNELNMSHTINQTVKYGCTVSAIMVCCHSESRGACPLATIHIDGDDECDQKETRIIDMSIKSDSVVCDFYVIYLSLFCLCSIQDRCPEGRVVEDVVRRTAFEPTSPFSLRGEVCPDRRTMTCQYERHLLEFNDITWRTFADPCVSYDSVTSLGLREDNLNVDVEAKPHFRTVLCVNYQIS